jgi:hypothetical protein
MYCIEENYRLLKYIKKPSEKVCLKALEISNDAIKYIKNPTSEMLKYCPTYIKNEKLIFTDYVNAFRINPNKLIQIKKKIEI